LLSCKLNFLKIKIGQKFEQRGDVFVSVPWSPVIYTKFTSPVCLPCMESNGITSLLRRNNILDGTKTSEQRCRIESKWMNRQIVE